MKNNFDLSVHKNTSLWKKWICGNISCILDIIYYIYIYMCVCVCVYVCVEGYIACCVYAQLETTNAGMPIK